MSANRYLIIGGGMTADAAAHGIRELDREGAISLISAESDPPYNRPPLTKGLWKGDSLDTIWRKTGDAAVDLHLGRRVTALDLPAKAAVDDLFDRRFRDFFARAIQDVFGMLRAHHNGIDAIRFALAIFHRDL